MSFIQSAKLAKNIVTQEHTQRIDKKKARFLTKARYLKAYNNT